MLKWDPRGIKLSVKWALILSLFLFSLNVNRFFYWPNSTQILYMAIFFVNFAMDPKITFLIYVPFSVFFEPYASLHLSSGKYLPYSTTAMFFHDWNRYLFKGSQVWLSSFDVMLIVFLMYGLVERIIRKNMPPFRPVMLFFPAYIGYVAFYFWYGISRGGSVDYALLQTKGLLYLPLICLLAAHYISDAKDVMLVSINLLAVALIKVFQTVHFANIIARHLREMPRSLSYSHDETMFYVLGMLIVFFAAKLSGKKWAAILAYTLIAFMFMGLVYANRRIAFAPLGLAMLLPILIYNGPAKRSIKRSLAVFLVLSALAYAALYFAPPQVPLSGTVKHISTGFSMDSGDTSNLYRIEENRNLWWNIREKSYGYGFGVVLPNKKKPFARWGGDLVYKHNGILQMWAITGTPGFILFCGFWGWLIFYAAYLHSKTDNAVYSALTLFTVWYAASFLIFSFYDIGLSFYRQYILIGLLSGMAFSLKDKYAVRVRNIKRSQAPQVS